MLTAMSLMDSLAHIGNTILTPFYWIISGIMVLFHHLLSPVFGVDSGITWVLCIILMTCVLRAVMLPLYKKQMNGARAMTSVQPQLKALQEKYKGDRERLSRETMKLYEENGVSPYASCLPMIVQMPVFMGLFWVLNSAARYTGPGSATPLKGYWMVHNPSLAESLRDSTIFGAKLSITFTSAGAWNSTRALCVVLVVLMMAILFLQQLHMMRRNMPPASMTGPMGQQQKMMLYVFPLFYIIGGINVPIGVLFYWVISNAWTYVQQYWIIRHYPTPDTPAYLDWEDRMIAEGKDPKAIEAARLEKSRKKRSGKGASMMQAAMERQAAAREAAEHEQAERASGSSQAVVRTDEKTGKKVVVRTQPRNQSRSKRRK
ncbi:MAG: membrane protein insertase YidC [Propionibacteriaceae bacterium]|nr:membrane protein insertase YidC [Propionibacteriaceae bacterium]